MISEIFFKPAKEKKRVNFKEIIDAVLNIVQVVNKAR